MAGKLFKMIVRHRRTGKEYMRYFKTKKGFSAAKKAAVAGQKRKLALLPKKAGGGAKPFPPIKAKTEAAVKKRISSIDRKIRDVGKFRTAGSVAKVKELRAEKKMLTKMMKGHKGAQTHVKAAKEAAKRAKR